MKKFLSALLISLLAFQLSAESSQWITEKFPSKLINRRGKQVDTATALQGKIVAVYFSASWCGPCRGFTPKLVEFYKKAKRRGNIEIVFISSDKDENAMMKYIKDDKMPWLTAPFRHQTAMKLKSQLRVNGIPTLVVFGKDGKLISRDARWDVTILGVKALRAWRDPEYKPLTYEDWLKKSGNDKKSDRQNKKQKKSR